MNIHIYDYNNTKPINEKTSFTKMIPDFKEMSMEILLNTNKYLYISSAEEISNQLNLDQMLSLVDFEKMSLSMPDSFISYHNENPASEVENELDKLYKLSNIHRCYSILRKNDYCKLKFTLSLRMPVNNSSFVYRSTIKNFELCCIHLFKMKLPFILSKLPELEYLPLAKDGDVIRKLLLDYYNIKYKKLTKSEVKVLTLAGAGFSTEKLAQMLNLSYHTVTTYRKRILQKLRAKNMTHAVKIALLEGLIT